MDSFYFKFNVCLGTFNGEYIIEPIAIEIKKNKWLSYTEAYALTLDNIQDIPKVFKRVNEYLLNAGTYGKLDEKITDNHMSAIQIMKHVTKNFILNKLITLKEGEPRPANICKINNTILPEYEILLDRFNKYFYYLPKNLLEQRLFIFNGVYFYPKDSFLDFFVPSVYVWEHPEDKKVYIHYQNRVIPLSTSNFQCAIGMLSILDYFVLIFVLNQYDIFTNEFIRQRPPSQGMLFIIKHILGIPAA